MSKPKSFSVYASNLLNSTLALSRAQSPPPLFYSAAQYELGIDADDDIHGNSDDETQSRYRTHPSGRSLDLSHLSTESLTESSVDGTWKKGKQTATEPLNGFPSRMWEAPAISIRGFGGKSRIQTKPASRGWKAHESIAESVGEVYKEQDSDYSEDEPPSFLDVQTGKSVQMKVAETDDWEQPLLSGQDRVTYVYPRGSRGYYQDSVWIVIYGAGCLLSLFLLVRMWLATSSDPYSSLFPTLPVLSLLALVSLVAGLSCTLYLLTINNAVNQLVFIALFGGPLILVLSGAGAWTASFATDGVESDQGWKLGMRLFGLLLFLSAYLFVRLGLDQRKSVKRTVMVLQLASSVLIDHPPAVLFCLSLSVLSTIMTLPFLFMFSNLISAYTPILGWLAFRVLTWDSALLFCMYMWTLGFLRGLQRVTISGVVGAWYFKRHDPTYPSAFEVTRSSFERAIGPSLGTILFASFVTSISETLTFIVKRLRRTLHSRDLPWVLSPLTYLLPFLTLLHGWLSLFTGYVLTYAGITGDDYLASTRKVKDLVLKNGTLGLGDNLLVKTVLTITSLFWGLAFGVVAFYISSSRLPLEDSRYAPILATLCVVLPVWTLKLCQGIVEDATDCLFIAFNLDLEKNVNHCHKASEAFSEPDNENWA